MGEKGDVGSAHVGKRAWRTDGHAAHLNELTKLCLNRCEHAWPWREQPVLTKRFGNLPKLARGARLARALRAGAMRVTVTRVAAMRVAALGAAVSCCALSCCTCVPALNDDGCYGSVP